ncbi:peptidase M19 [Massilia sp. KIM]|uniref:dipeptidase n=1 Tax=Massilia sp. KIM TaxID=1955422 RepID=UPI00098F64F3|nr:membrane dipeptidase [Massilia sp. KIM]OON62447.1 peptidase M19 [Massilia sp. KIM]
MKALRYVSCAILTSSLMITGCASSTNSGDEDLALHRRLFTLDAHLDTPIHFGRPGWDFGARHNPTHELAQLDLGRMAEGSLDGGFFVIFTEQGPLTQEGYASARAHALSRSSSIDRTLARYQNRIGIATNIQEARQLNAAGKLVAFKSIENSYPLGDDLNGLTDFHRHGVRLAGIVHSKNNQLADSSTDAPVWNGLSPLGQRWVAEMNRLGMVIDASHASDAAVDQMLALSSAPLLLSHSNARSSYDHPRNLDDERIRRVADAGGAICASTIYLSKLRLGPRRTVLFDQMEKLEEMSPAEQVALSKEWRALDASAPLWETNFDQYMKALLRLIKIAGVDHVCMGADFDGGGGFQGLQEVSQLPRVTARLRRAGLSESDIAKIWSGNILRVLQAANERTQK